MKAGAPFSSVKQLSRIHSHIGWFMFHGNSAHYFFFQTKFLNTLFRFWKAPFAIQKRLLISVSQFCRLIKHSPKSCFFLISLILTSPRRSSYLGLDTIFSFYNWYYSLTFFLSYHFPGFLGFLSGNTFNNMSSVFLILLIIFTSIIVWFVSLYWLNKSIWPWKWIVYVYSSFSWTNK